MFGGLIGMTLGGESAGEGPGDEALIRAAQRGDAKAFEQLHRRYYTRIYRLAYLKTNNASDAEDVAAETFLRALAHLPKFRFQNVSVGRQSLYPWLHRITLNLIADSGRRRAPGSVISLDEPTAQGLRALLTAKSAEATPQQLVERHEVQQMVRDAIAALPQEQGEVLIYRHLGELSLREIAPLMHRSESAVKSLLHRAVVALRSELERRIFLAEQRSAVICGRGEAAPNVGATVMDSRRRSDR